MHFPKEMDVRNTANIQVEICLLQKQMSNIALVKYIKSRGILCSWFCA